MWQWYADPQAARRARPTACTSRRVDLQHGFSLQPLNMNFQVLPGYDHVLTITPDVDGRVHHRLQRILRHRPPQDDRQNRRRVGDAMPTPSPPRRWPCLRRDSARRRQPRRRRGAAASTTGLPVCLAAQRFIKLQRRRRASSSCCSAASPRCCSALTRWQAVHLLPRRLVLPHPDVARAEHADLLDPLLRGRDPLLRLHHAAERAAASPKVAWAVVRHDAHRRA